MMPRGARGPAGRGRGRGGAAKPQICKVGEIPEGLVPKMIQWKQLKPAVVEQTIFKGLKEEDFDKVKVDFDLVTE